MTSINFLPQRFIQQQRSRARRVRQTGLIVIVVGCLATWFVVMQGQASALDGLVRARQQQAEAQQQQMTELDRLQRAKQQLMYQIAIQQNLMIPVSYPVVLASISKLMPVELALTDLSMVCPPPKPTRAPKDPKSGVKAPNATPPAESRVIRMDMVGLSPTDMEIANFVGQLSQHPLFQSVKMRYSRATRVGNTIARQFRIEMEVPLDRQYRVQAGLNEEMAHVD